MLVRVARAEIHRRHGHDLVSGPELDDLAQQAAGDALVAILAKLDRFRGESRFTTWAYRFVVLEVSSKLGRHFWRRPGVVMDAGDWERLPDRFGLAPDAQAERSEMIRVVSRAVAEELTEHQREVFVALVVDGVPLDALALRLGSSRNAIYKTMFDARRKLRVHLAANGYMDSAAAAKRGDVGGRAG
jgi:RNA polymerase sigma-70 factor (ECF subfamily)